MEGEKVELTKATKSKISNLFSSSSFKSKLESITGRKASSFGKKPSDAEVKSEVSTKMDDLKTKQRSEAEAKAARERDAKLAKSKEASAAKKGFLKQKLEDAKARLRERLDSINDPVKRQENCV